MKEGAWLILIGICFLIVMVVAITATIKNRSAEGLNQQVFFDNRIYNCKEVKQVDWNNSYKVTCRPIN